MHIKCSKNDLLVGLQLILPAISTKTSLPILGNVLLKAEEKGTVNLVSTDLEISIQTHINAEIIQPGNVTIPAKKLEDIARELGTNDVEIRSNEDSKIFITSGKSKFNIMGLNEEDFPVIPEYSDSDNSFVIKKDILKDMIRKTIFAVSYDETRYVLNGVCLEVKGNNLRMVATDGRRLSYISKDVDTGKDIDISVIIPTKTVGELSKLMGLLETTDITVSLKDNQIAFKMDDNIMISKIIEGSFPNYDQVIPKNSELLINLPKEELTSVTKRVSLLSNDKTHSLKYIFGNNKLQVTASTQGVGEAEDEIDIDYSGDTLEIAYNPNFILDILRNIEDDNIDLELSTPVNPGVLKPKDDKSYLCVIMPMRI